MTTDIERRLLAAFELQQKGSLAEAEEGFLKVLAAEPENIHALNLLGINYLETKRYDDAVRSLRKAAAVTPNDGETLNNLGLALAKAGNVGEAVTQFRHAIENAGPNTAMLVNLGAALVEAGQAHDALAPLSQALKMSPPTPDLLANLAKALSELGRYEEARPAAEQAVSLRPEAAAHQNILGEILLKQGRHIAARACFKRSLAEQPEQIEATVSLATTYKEEGKIDKAEKILNELAFAYPSSPEPFFNLGVLAEQVGHAEKALGHFQQSLSLDPSFAKGYYQAAQLKGVTLPSSFKVGLRRCLENRNLSDNDRMLMHFALATIQESEGDYSLSIAELRRAHEGLRSSYDPQATERMHARQRAVFSKEFTRALQVRSSTTTRPLFVLGMPRSGTSLVEQFLSAHPAIEGGGESSILTDCSNEAARMARKPFPECIRVLSQDELSRLGENYRDRLFAGKRDASWVIDKTPLNFQLIGFARAILPEARFIHCQRDPLNTCLSIYKIPFDQNQNYAASFASLGHFYCAYRKLMEHWRSYADDDLCEVGYEAVVEDIEGEARRVLDWLGLEFDPSVLKFYEQNRLVRTPSATQVNQPIYRGSLALAERYGAALVELKQALADCYG